MTSTPEAEAAAGGAMFLDGSHRNLGWAVRVVKRKPSPGGLTTLDVTTSDAALTTSLLMLDKHRLFVMSEGESFVFAWASGYQNGREIRIQGVLAAG